MQYSPGATKKDGRILVLAAAIITGLRLARDPRAGCQTGRVIDAVEDGVWLANQIYEKALLSISHFQVHPVFLSLFCFEICAITSCSNACKPPRGECVQSRAPRL